VGRSQRTFLQGVFLLTLAAFVTKVLSAVYRVPFQNIVGDIGFYIYQQVYPIYGIVLTLSMYGFPVIISKILTEQPKEDFKKRKEILTSAFFSMSLFGVVLFSVTYFGGPLIASIMGDPNLFLLLQVAAVSFLFFPIISVIRGYYQSVGFMVPTAISQVTEQFIRVALILILSFLFVQKGYSLYLVGGGAILGSVLGSVACIFVLIGFLMARKEKTRWIFSSLKLNCDVGIQVLIQGIAICISSMTLILFQLVDAMSLYKMLVESGWSEWDGKVLKGIYDRGQPLVQVGTVVATSMSLALVPILTKEKLRGSTQRVQSVGTLALKVSIVFGLGASVGLACLIQPINEMLFTDRQGSDVLAVFCLSVLFYSIVLTLSAVLQGLGYMYFPMFAVCVGVIGKFLANIALIPSLYTMGASLSTVGSLVIISMFLIWKVHKELQGFHLTKTFFGHLFISIGSMVLVLFVLQLIVGSFDSFTTSRLSSTLLSISGSILGGMTFLAVFIHIGGFDLDELKQIPFGEKLKVFRKARNKNNKLGA
jgi:polysaccharide transporter, PST family